MRSNAGPQAPSLSPGTPRAGQSRRRSSLRPGKNNDEEAARRPALAANAESGPAEGAGCSHWRDAVRELIAIVAAELVKIAGAIAAMAVLSSGGPVQLTFGSASDLARALRRAADAYAQHEAQTGHPDPDWPAWYARYLEREQAGREHVPAFPARVDGPAVPVAVVTSRTEAELIVGMLRNNDLRAAVSADDAGGQYPALQTEGVRVLVAPSDEAAARRLLAPTDDTP